MVYQLSVHKKNGIVSLAQVERHAETAVTVPQLSHLAGKISVATRAAPEFVVVDNFIPRRQSNLALGQSLLQHVAFRKATEPSAVLLNQLEAQTHLLHQAHPQLQPHTCGLMQLGRMCQPQPRYWA